MPGTMSGVRNAGADRNCSLPLKSSLCSEQNREVNACSNIKDKW